MRRLLVRLAVSSIISLGATAAIPANAPEKPTVHEHRTMLVAAAAPAGASRTVDDVGLGAEMVGLTWKGAATASFAVRGKTATGWSSWLPLEGSPDEGPDSGQPDGANTTAGPAWVGHDVRAVQVRVVSGSPAGLELVALDTEAPRSGSSLVALPAAGAVVPAPFIIPRSDWGADETWRSYAPECDGRPRYATDVRFAVVHHTVNENTYGPNDSAALLRGIYHFHTHTNGWCDIAYNFIVDRFGQIFEGRFGGASAPVLGGHTGGFNSGSTGVAVLGDFETSAVPASTYASLRDLLAWKLGYHGVDPLGSTVEVAGDNPSSKWPLGTVVTLPNIEGHRDSNVTTCPGQYLYALLPKLRLDVSRIITAPAHRDTRLVCDWDGDGVDTPGTYEDGYWAIRQTNDEGANDVVVHYGIDGYLPVCGDWNGDGTDSIGVYDRGWWYLRNSNTPGSPDLVVNYGIDGYRPMVGRWGGGAADGIGVYVDGSWYLRNTASPGRPEVAFAYGIRGYKPFAGDWDGDGADGIGVMTAGQWYLRQTPSPGGADLTFPYGVGTDTPLAGRWTDSDVDLADGPGVARGSYWFLRNSFTGLPNEIFPFPRPV